MFVKRRLELCFETFRRDMSVESFGVCAVVIDHEILSDPIQQPHLGMIQLLVHRRVPPICWYIGGTLIDAHCPIPLASPCSEMIKTGLEWCTFPVGLDMPASGGPVVCIP